MRTRAKVDGNQGEIVAALRKLGATVQSLAALGKGCPDLLVGYAGRNYLLEIKIAGGKVRPDQADWHATWHGQVAVVTTWQEAAYACGAFVKEGK
jgi:hypothetical protein